MSEEGKSKRLESKYVILKLSDDVHSGSADLWMVAGESTGMTSQLAVRRFLGRQDHALTDGTYVAVSKRFWFPVTVKLETKTTLKLS